MKLAILGGGGFRVPHVYRALLSDRGAPRVDDVWLHDIDPSRLESIAGLLAAMADGVPDAPSVSVTTSLDDAVRDSDFLFTAVRVGGLAGRVCDERVALGLDVLGQETTGPGGIAYGLRTIPVMLEVARRVRELAPSAYVINFTNPAGMITEAMQAILGDRVLGICDTPSGLGRRVAAVMGLDARRTQLDYVGLNHLGWLRRLLWDGVDVLPDLLADDARLALLEETTIFGPDWLRSLGSIPNEYLFYYYFTRDAVRSILDAPRTRGEFLRAQQHEFFDRIRHATDGGLALWRQTVATRRETYMAEARTAHHTVGTLAPPGAPDDGYAGVALAVMTAISRNERATMILNVRNGSAVAGLPADAVVEIPTLVDANGVHPLATTPPPLSQLGLMQQVKAAERGTIQAATTRSAAAARMALATHPLVDSVTVASRLFESYTRAIPELADLFTR